MKVTELDVQALVYSVGHDSVRALWFSKSGRSELELSGTQDLLPKVDELRSELTRTLDVAIGKVPALHEFMTDWGRDLLPAAIRADPPDVLVLIPNSMLHDLPMHLVHLDSGRHLGAECGITYCSGTTLFTSCARRNPSRKPDAPSERALHIAAVDVAAGSDDAFVQLAHTLADRFADTGPVSLGAPADRGWVLNRFRPLERFGEAADVVCLIAHGDIDPERHQLSGLLLGTHRFQMGSKTSLGAPIDGNYYHRRDLPLRTAPMVTTTAPSEVLSAAELEVFGYSTAELVCLLGCSAGSGRVLQADEPASLAETFLKLGTAAVIAPMWDAHIQPTGAWITRFFDSWLREGRPKALAARDATAEALNRYEPQLAGVLTLRGDWL
jgi:hypothetical protein